MEFKKILIVEDDDAIRETARESLEHGGYEVIEAENAFDGLDLFEKTNPDLVISDYVLPGMSGESLFIQIRRSNDTPFIMISGYEKGGHLTNQLNYTFLAKPFDRTLLLDTVANALTVREHVA